MGNCTNLEPEKRSLLWYDGLPIIALLNMGRRKKYHFVQYSGRGRGTVSPDAITITRSETIGLPAKFLEAHHLTRHYGVVLYYDPKRLTIGMHFTTVKEADSIKITRYEAGGGSIACTRFFRHQHLDFRKHAGVYPYKRVRRKGMPELYVIQLRPGDELRASITQ